MITIAITSWNRDSMTFDSFRQVLNDDRISEIVIVDDHSEERIYNNLVFMCNGLEKVKMFRNEKNLGCYHNKRKSIELSSNQWVILLDSDNIIGKDYVDALFEKNQQMEDGSYSGWCDWVIYQPEFAKPHFDFRNYSNKSFDKELARHYLHQTTFLTMLNAQNFFVNKKHYLEVFDTTKTEPWTADSIYFNYLWLKAGKSIFVTPNLQYSHLVHNGSHYKNNVHRTGNFYNEVVKKLKEL